MPPGEQGASPHAQERPRANRPTFRLPPASGRVKTVAAQFARRASSQARRRAPDHDPVEHRRNFRHVVRDEPARKELLDDPEYKRRLDAGKVQPPKPAEEIQLQTYPKRSVAIFLGAVLVICAFGFFDEIRPTIANEGGGTEALSVTPIIQMVMLTAGALILLACRVKAADVPGMPIFRSGVVAMIALFGIAWMADTFIANNEDAIVSALGDLTNKWPFMIAVSIFLIAAPTTSESTATRTMVPFGLALGIGVGYMIAMWTAVVGVPFLPANDTQIAAAEADRTGTTTLGKRVLDHSFGETPARRRELGSPRPADAPRQTLCGDGRHRQGTFRRVTELAIACLGPSTHPPGHG